jgi:transcription elongation factor GreA
LKLPPFSAIFCDCSGTGRKTISPLRDGSFAPHGTSNVNSGPAFSRAGREELTEAKMDKVPMTADGHHALVEEIKHLKSVERPRIITLIEEARSHGDLSENAEYHAAKEQQSWLEARVSELEDKLSRAEIIDVSKLSGDTVKFGAHVTLIDEESEGETAFQIVGEFESDVKKGKVSILSPIARALIGKKKGDSVEVNTPGGGKSYEIAQVRYG